MDWWLPQPCPPPTALCRRICPSPSASSVLPKFELGDSGLLSWKGTKKTSCVTSLLRLLRAIPLLYLSTGFVSDGGMSVAHRRLLGSPGPGWRVLRDPNLSWSQGERGAQDVQGEGVPSQWIARHRPPGVSIPLPLKVTSLTCFFLKMSPPSGQV